MLSKLGLVSCYRWLNGRNSDKPQMAGSAELQTIRVTAATFRFSAKADLNRHPELPLCALNSHFLSNMQNFGQFLSGGEL